MKLTILGSGDAFCDWRVNYENNVVVHTADGLVMIDCGMTAVQSMKELGLSRHDVAVVLLTHVHPDHCSPSALLLERFYTGTSGPAWRGTRIVAPPDVLDPARRSLKPFFDEALGPEGGPKAQGLAGMIIGVPAHEVRVDGLTFRFFRVPHVTDIDEIGGGMVDKPAYGVEIHEGARKVVWSSDTTFRRNWIVETARDPAVVRLFHDCTFSTWYRATVHTHFSELESLPADVKAKITLMHHTQVPDDADISAFAGAAARHQVFEL